MHWKMKAAIFKALAALPFGEDAHYFLQKKVTRNWPRRPEALQELFIAAQWIERAYRERNGTPPGKAHFIEIGAGRDCAVAVALRLMGVAKITCIDVKPLAKLELIEHAARTMAGRLGMTPPVFRTWDDLRAFGIDYKAPATLMTAGLPEHGADCFFSVDTLEHIPEAELRRIVAEAKRVLKPEGTLIHLVDYSDHFARTDGKISRFNFLQYSDAEWRPYNSDYHYVNRMRHSQYVDLFQSGGFEIVDVEPDREPVQESIIKNLAEQFRQFNREDLFTIRARIVATPAENVSAQSLKRASGADR
jgi:SAM-dependent methyltransferase